MTPERVASSELIFQFMHMHFPYNTARQFFPVLIVLEMCECFNISLSRVILWDILNIQTQLNVLAIKNSTDCFAVVVSDRLLLEVWHIKKHKYQLSKSLVFHCLFSPSF